MKIEVGIYHNPENERTSKPYGWITICEQEKVPHKITDKPDCPVIVFEGYTPKWFSEFMEAGGIGIVTDCNPMCLPFSVDCVFETAIEFIDLSDLDSSTTRVSCIGKVFNGIGFRKNFCP